MTDEANGNQLERCLKAVEEKPGSATAQFNLGLAYTRQGRVDKAEQSYRKALELNPDLIEAWVNLGGALMLQWDFEGSIEANREALKRDDRSILANYNIGQACVYLSDGEGIVRANRRVIELAPQHAAAHYFLGVGLLATGQVEAARQAVAQAKEYGHSPTPEILRALEQVQEGTVSEDGNLVQTIGADAPKNPNRR